MTRKIKKIRGEHGLNFFISYQMKERLQRLAKKYDKSLADMVRTILKIGIPVLEGLTEAEENLVKEFSKVVVKNKESLEKENLSEKSSTDA